MKRFSDSFNSVLKNTGLMGGVQLVTVLMSILRNKATAIFVGSWGVGLIDMYSRSVDLVCSGTNFGIAFSAVRRLAELEERGEKRAIEQYIRIVRSWVLITAILGTVVCIVLSPYLSRWLMNDPGTTKAFLLLSPMVGMLALTGGELAILKGLHRLRTLAKVNTIGAFCSVAIVVPMYAWLGVHGIIPVLLLTTFAILLLNARAACRLYPYRLGLGSKSLLKRGSPMVKLGIAFILAGFLSSGAEMGVREFLRRMGGLDEVGLYAVGLTLTISYARLVFSAMDADYFPRLSAAAQDKERCNCIINRQIDVLVLLMAPFLMAFGLFAPLIVRLLYTAEFLPAVPMIVCALAHMFFKAVYSPIAYLPLAKGHSLTYMVMEMLYAVVFVTLVILGYRYLGLPGAGLGLSLANFFDLCSIMTIYHFRYGFRFEGRTLLRVCYQGVLLICVLMVLYAGRDWGQLILAGFLLLVSLFLSWRLLRKETTLMEKFCRLGKRIKK